MEKIDLLGNLNGKKVLIYLLNHPELNFIFKISKGLGLEHANISNTLRLLKSINLIDSKAEGRIKIIKLTEKGKNIAINLKKIDELL